MSRRGKRQTRDQLLREMVEERRLLMEALSSLSRDDLQRPGVIGHWSLKDLLGHLASWDEMTVRFLRLLKEGRFWPEEETIRDIASWNEQEVARKRALTLDEVMENLRGASEMAAAEVAELTPADLEKRVPLPWDQIGTVRHMILTSGPEHDRKHREDILRFRKSIGRPAGDDSATVSPGNGVSL